MTTLETILTSILSSTAFATLINSIITKRSKDKTDKLQYITGERKQWRTDLRYALVALRQLYQSKKNSKLVYNTQVSGGLQFVDYAEAKSWFITRLNPLNLNELAVCNKIGSILSDKDIEFIEHDIALILKLDWERVKKEVKESNTKNKQEPTFKCK